jgi:Leucine-rich repeat (LRR) protein
MESILLTFLSICQLLGIAHACPEECRCYGKTLDCSFSALFEHPVAKEHNFHMWNFSGNEITSLADKSVENSVTSVTNVVDYSNNKITTIEEKFFLNFRALRELQISNNKLNDIGFTLSPTLEILTASNNSIQRWPDNNLVQLQHLKDIHFDHNLLKSMNCSSDINSMFDSLEKLDLSFNEIEHIDICVFQRMPSLYELNVSSNKLNTLTNGLFNSNVQLQRLDLSNNMLRSIPNGIFEKVPNLAFLRLSGNQLVTFPTQLPILEVLDLSFNQISIIEESDKENVYPHEFLFLGGNPFHCDCRVQWLKEFLDTREYQLHYLDIPEEKFIPVCRSPSALSNESWNYLSSELFVCDFENLQNEVGVEDSHIQKKLELEVVDVGDTSVKLRWSSFQAMTVAESTYQLKYHKFGHKDEQITRTFRSPSLSYILQNLTAGTAYVICLRELVTASSENFEFDCVEIVMKEDNVLFAYVIFACILSTLFYMFKV